MKHLAAFGAFLRQTVNLNQTRLDQLDSRVAAIVSCLQQDATLGDRVEDHVPQGSWAHRTIIKPLPGDEFDADILLELTEEPDWEEDPGRYLREVRAAFQRSTTYRGKVERKNRCVRVRYAGDCHVDVVPCITTAAGTRIVNYAEKKFEATNPEGFTEWMRVNDTTTGGHLRKVIRLLKYLRDFKGTFKVPSVILTTLLGGRVTTWDAANRYSDLPTALRTLMEDLDAYLRANPTMPYLEDPSCPGTSFNHRWCQSEYETFSRKVSDYLAWIGDAYDEPDSDKSLKAWQRVFGEPFQRPAPKSGRTGTKELQASAVGGARQAAPQEEFIDDRFPINQHGGITVDAHVSRDSGFVEGLLSRLGSVYKSKRLLFRATVHVNGPFDLYWKVRNTGVQAERLGQLRGEISRDAGQHQREETTAYTGVHYVECYAVQGGEVVATGRIDVVVRD